MRHRSSRNDTGRVLAPPSKRDSIAMKLRPSVLGVLGRIAKQRTLEPFMRTKSFLALDHFLQGAAYGLDEAGVLVDHGYQDFLAWLRKRGQCPAVGGWPKYFLEAASGDDERALELFLATFDSYSAEVEDRSETQ
jgi:hypothetical protein